MQLSFMETNIRLLISQREYFCQLVLGSWIAYGLFRIRNKNQNPLAFRLESDRLGAIFSSLHEHIFRDGDFVGGNNEALADEQRTRRHVDA